MTFAATQFMSVRRVSVMLGAALLFGGAAAWAWSAAGGLGSTERVGAGGSAPARVARSLVAAEPTQGGVNFAATFARRNLAQSAEGAESQSALVRRWAESDLAGAADAVSALSAEALTADLVNSVVLPWAARNWDAAVAWAQRLPQGEARQAGLVTLALEAARVDPLTALSLGLTLAPDAQRESMMVNAATQLATQEPDLAAQWAAGLPQSRLRDRMLAQVAAIWGERDPRAASMMVLEQLTPGTARNNALVGIVQRWVQVQPEAAASWAASFPEGALRTASVDNAVRLWAERDLRAAGEWLGRLAPGNARDVGVSSYVEKLVVADPVSAESWAVAIGDPGLRQRGLEAVARSRRSAGD
jgi:hypothetical protein